MIHTVNTEPTSIFAFTGRALDKDVGLQSTLGAEKGTSLIVAR
jgi:hypothetical protein